MALGDYTKKKALWAHQALGPHQVNMRTFMGPPQFLANPGDLARPENIANMQRVPRSPFMPPAAPGAPAAPGTPEIPPERAGASPTLQAMMAHGPVSDQMFSGMQKAREQGLLREQIQQPGPMPPPPTTPPLAAFTPGAAAKPPAFNPAQAAPGGMLPDQKAIIDAMTGKRVHKGLGGQQLGMEGVNPALKYMLYSMRNRRHIGMGGQEIY